MNLLFVCHGNICRSPMAEFICKELLRRRGITHWTVRSCATSREEIGNDVYPPAQRELRRQGIPFTHRRAWQITPADYAEADLVLAMDFNNLRSLRRLLGDDPQGKIHLLMDYTDTPGEVSDPWYTDRFDIAYQNILAGCEGLLVSLGVPGE